MQPLLTLWHAGRKDDQLQRTDGGFSHTSPLIIFNLPFPHPSQLDTENWLFHFMHFLLHNCILSFLSLQLSLFNVLLSLIHSLTHFHTLFYLLVLVIRANKFLSAAWSCNVCAVKLKVMQIKCVRAMYINL